MAKREMEEVTYFHKIMPASFYQLIVINLDNNLLPVFKLTWTFLRTCSDDNITPPRVDLNTTLQTFKIKMKNIRQQKYIS